MLARNGDKLKKKKTSEYNGTATEWVDTNWTGHLIKLHMILKHIKKHTIVDKGLMKKNIKWNVKC